MEWNFFGMESINSHQNRLFLILIGELIWWNGSTRSAINNQPNKANPSIQQKTTFCLCVGGWFVCWLSWLAPHPFGGGPRAPFTNSIDSLFVLLHWFINSSIPQRQITQVNWFVHFTFILASFIVHFVCFVWLLSLLCGAVRQLPPLTHPKSKSTKQTHFTIHSAHQQFNLAFLGWAWKAKEKLEIELMVGWVALRASCFAKEKINWFHFHSSISLFFSSAYAWGRRRLQTQFILNFSSHSQREEKWNEWFWLASGLKVISFINSNFIHALLHSVWFYIMR